MPKNSIMVWQKVLAVVGTIVCIAAAASYNQFEHSPVVSAVAAGLFLGYICDFGSWPLFALLKGNERGLFLGSGYQSHIFWRVFDAVHVFILIGAAAMIVWFVAFNGSVLSGPFGLAFFLGGVVVREGVVPVINEMRNNRT